MYMTTVNLAQDLREITSIKLELYQQETTSDSLVPDRLVVTLVSPDQDHPAATLISLVLDLLEAIPAQDLQQEPHPALQMSP